MERDTEGQQRRGQHEAGPSPEVQVRQHATQGHEQDPELPAREPLAPDRSAEHDRKELVARPHDGKRDPSERDGMRERDDAGVIDRAGELRAGEHDPMHAR